MREDTLSKRNINESRLRLMSQIVIGWLVFGSIIPGFLTRIFYVDAPLIGAVSWATSILLFAGLMGYLFIKFFRGWRISRVALCGVLFISCSQALRIGYSLGLFEIAAVAAQENTVRALDDLIAGIGISMVLLAVLYLTIEILTSRQHLLAERASLIAEMARREKAEKDLRKREALLEGINTSAVDGIIVMDNAGRVAYWNSGAEKILGYSAEEIIGEPVHETLAPAHLQQAYKRGLVKWRLSGEGPQGPLVGNVTEFKAMNKNGEEVDVELAVSSMAVDNEWHAVGILRDLTQRKRAEQEYKTILQTAMDGFIIVNREGRFLDVNETYCAMLGYTREEMLTLRIEDVEASETAGEIAAHIQKIYARGFDRFETRQRRKDGVIIDVEVSANPTTPGGRERICAFQRDITERKRLERERQEFEARVQHTQKLESLGVLAGGIAHDFNNILQIITITVNMLEPDIPKESPSAVCIEKLKKSVGRASALTQQMLAYSGRRSIALRPVHLGSVVDQIVHLIRSSVSKKVALRMNLSPDLPCVEADAAQIEQVIMNLVLNASEALDEEHGGTVTVSTRVLDYDENFLSANRAPYNAPPGVYVCLEVADTGCGMDDETRKKLFDPFFTTKFTGRGLGMSAVLGIMRAHKGAIVVKSAPGEGTTIRALFPPTADDAPALLEDDCEALVAAPKGQRTVLLVDDEQDVLALGTLMLEQLGCEVFTASDGLDAVEVFKARCKEIDGVLLDMSMPHLDGLQTFHKLRDIRPDVRVILASGYAEQDIAPHLSEQGIRAFMAKPYDMKTLAASLTKALG